jgi:hypothetical protein
MMEMSEHRNAKAMGLRWVYAGEIYKHGIDLANTKAE